MAENSQAGGPSEHEACETHGSHAPEAGPATTLPGGNPDQAWRDYKRHLESQGKLVEGPRESLCFLHKPDSDESDSQDRMPALHRALS